MEVARHLRQLGLAISTEPPTSEPAKPEAAVSTKKGRRGRKLENDPQNDRKICQGMDWQRLLASALMLPLLEWVFQENSKALAVQWLLNYGQRGSEKRSWAYVSQDVRITAELATACEALRKASLDCSQWQNARNGVTRRLAIRWIWPNSFRSPTLPG